MAFSLTGDKFQEISQDTGRTVSIMNVVVAFNVKTSHYSIYKDMLTCSLQNARNYGRGGRGDIYVFIYIRASLVALRVKCLPAMQETRVRSLGQEGNGNPPLFYLQYLEKEMATHSSTLALKTPWTETCRLQFMGSQRIRHD